MSFDPAIFVKAMKPPGGSPEAFRRRHRAAFDGGYAIGTDEIDQKTRADFCRFVEDFFDGKHDFYGNLKETPEAPVPGLTIRDQSMSIDDRNGRGRSTARMAERVCP